MKKKYIILTILIIFILIGIGTYYYISKNNSSSENPNSNYDAFRVSSNNTTDQNSTNTENHINTNTENTNNSNNTNTSTNEQPTETEIASYTTKILTDNDNRDKNVSLTCSALNDTIVENGSTFSFCDTVGQSTTSKGYEKANVFQDGEEVEAVGGGKCQVSSTLYNAVLEIADVEIVERHPHSGEVYYVPEGQDAAVAYGSYDFKFKNNTGSSLKIKAESTTENVIIKILKLE